MEDYQISYIVLSGVLLDFLAILFDAFHALLDCLCAASHSAGKLFLNAQTPQIIHCLLYTSPSPRD